MKILLCEDVDKLGWLGDIVEVKDGFARNYLLPQGIGTVPTEAGIKTLADEKAKRTEARKAVHQTLEELAQSVDGAEAVVASKANEQGHLFGSVAEGAIAGNLREQGFAVSDDMVQLPQHIKEVGTHEVTLKISKDLTAKVNVVVVAQDETIESTDEDIEK